MSTETATRTGPVIPTGAWSVDPSHSTVGFSVKHMGIANVRGKFTEFEGTLQMKEKLADCKAHGTVKVASTIPTRRSVMSTCARRISSTLSSSRRLRSSPPT